MNKEKVIGIIGGKGIMGSFFADIFQKQGFSVIISDINTQISNKDLCTQSDIIIFSVPISITTKIIEEVSPYITLEKWVCDFTSLKSSPLEAMLQTRATQVLGIHPMFAPPTSGNIAGQKFVLCPGRGGNILPFFLEIFQSLGASIMQMEAKKHDEIMSIVQALSHFVDITFINTLKELNTPLDLISQVTSPVYDMKTHFMGRILYQDPYLYGPIQIENPQSINTIETFLSTAKNLLSKVEAKDIDGFVEIFKQGNEYLGDRAREAQEKTDDLIDFWAHMTHIQDKSNQNREIKNTPTGNIGILGPQYTFSHLAFLKAFHDKEKELQFFPSIPSIFSALKEQKITEIFVPVENLLHGTVGEAIDGITKSNLPIQKLFEMPIKPTIFVRPQYNDEEIKEIYSHPQALAQCSQFLTENFPQAQCIPTNSTTAAVERMLTEHHSAAIAPPEILDYFQVKPLYRDIANTAENATRFAFLSTEQISTSSSKYETAIAFTFPKDTPGALEHVLQIFSEEEINLTKIESRPTGMGFGDYLFLIQFEGKCEGEEKTQLSKKLQEQTSELYFLGSFGIEEI